MKPKTFFKKLSDKINELEPEKKKELFTKSNLKVFKRISEYCDQGKKVMVIKEFQLIQLLYTKKDPS